MNIVFTLLGCRAIKKLLELQNIMNKSNKLTSWLEEIMTSISS